VEADDGGGGSEGADAEDGEEEDFLAPRPMDRRERLGREDEDPDVGDNVEAGGC